MLPREFARQVASTLTSYITEPSMGARHRRFVKNQQKRAAQQLRRDGEEEVDEDSESSDDDLSTSARIQTSSISSIAATSPPKIATGKATSLSSIIAASTSVVFDSPVAISTSVVQSPTPRPSIAVSVSAERGSIPIVTTPQVQVSASPKTTGSGVSSKATPSPSTALGVSTKAKPSDNADLRRTASMSGTSIALIILGVLGFLVAIAIAFWALRRYSKRSRAAKLDFHEKRYVPRAPERESRIWGGTTTVGTLTEANFPPSQMPASMQPSGRFYHPSVPDTPRAPQRERQLWSGNKTVKTTTEARFPPSQISPSLSGSEGLAPRNGELDGQYFSRPISTRWPGSSVSRESIATTIPHFKGIKSWAIDQTMRNGVSDAPTMPNGRYRQI